MGGLMILAGVTVATLLWADLSNPYVWVVLGVTLAYRRHRLLRRLPQGDEAARLPGFGGWARLRLEVLVAAIAGYVIMQLSHGRPGRRARRMPFFKDRRRSISGWRFVLLGVLVIAGAGNAVNLTDGLDGLAIVPVMIAAATFGLIAYLVGNVALRALSADPSRRRARASWPSSAAR